MSKYPVTLIFFLSAISLSLLGQDQVIPIWPDRAPGTERRQDREKWVENKEVSNVYQPDLTLFLPEPHTGEIPAILICPGGGYSKIVMEKEGYKVARWFNEQGIAAFVLKYRLKPDEALRDAQRAVSFLRNSADKYNIDSDRIGVIGFSAGAHLAGNLAFHYNQRMNIDEIDNVSSRPDFWVGVYGSYSNILEENGNTVVKELVPPAFLVHAGNDTKVPVMESVRMYAFLREHDIPAELHIYEQGEHGFALEVNRGPAVTSTVNDWSARLLDWMIIRGYR